MYDGFGGRVMHLQYGFAGGTFESLDTERVDMLRRTRKRCDRLMVGLSYEPAASFMRRKRALEELDCVDEVCVFHDADELATSIAFLCPSPCFVDERWREELELPDDALVGIEYCASGQVA